MFNAKITFPAMLCPDLTANPPLNGALTCENVTDGARCQLSCNPGFDMPRTAPSDGEYVCDDTQGDWQPNDVIPDCSGRWIGLFHRWVHIMSTKNECWHASNRVM